MTLREQLKQEMIRQGMDHCDVVEFVINPKRVITVLSEDNPVLSEDIEILEIRLWPKYIDYISNYIDYISRVRKKRQRWLK